MFPAQLIESYFASGILLLSSFHIHYLMQSAEENT